MNDPRSFYDIWNQLESHVLEPFLVQHPGILWARIRPDDVTVCMMLNLAKILLNGITYTYCSEFGYYRKENLMLSAHDRLADFVAG